MQKYYLPKQFSYQTVERGLIDAACFEEWKRVKKPKLNGRFDEKILTEEEKKSELKKALVKCVDCGESFSPHAKACPHCGCPIEVCLQEQSKR